jgi:hypothetical protein
MRGKPKFSPESLELALKLAGEGKGPTEIFRYLASKDLPHPSENAIIQLIKRPTHQPKIELYRQKWLSDVMAVDSSHKRIRLEIVDKTIKEITRTLVHLVGKNGSIQTKSLKRYLALTKRLNEYIESAREEIERKPLAFIHIEQNNLTNEELLSEQDAVDKRLLELKAGGIRISPATQDPIEAVARPAD